MSTPTTPNTEHERLLKSFVHVITPYRVEIAPGSGIYDKLRGDNEALNVIVDWCQALITQAERRAELKGRIDERTRVTYEHESFTKELFKDRVIDVKQWWLDTAAEAHQRRQDELKQM